MLGQWCALWVVWCGSRADNLTTFLDFHTINTSRTEQKGTEQWKPTASST
nr:MAG TPA: hypothetical protein [Caudoviricetes sp.]